jgi:hypothetical protein
MKRLKIMRFKDLNCRTMNFGLEVTLMVSINTVGKTASLA